MISISMEDLDSVLNVIDKRGEKLTKENLADVVKEAKEEGGSDGA